MTTHHDNHDAASGGGSCSGHAPSVHDLAHVGTEDLAECPVMVGTTVIKAQAEESGLYRDHQGTRYWLCCDSCGPLFDADPDRYTAA